MKAKIKFNGKEIDAFFDYERSCECKTSVWQSFIDDKLYYFNEKELDFIENSNCSTDWNNVRIQAAIAAMQGFCANYQLGDSDSDKIAVWSVEQADSLIKELKKTM